MPTPGGRRGLKRLTVPEARSTADTETALGSQLTEPAQAASPQPAHGLPLSVEGCRSLVEHPLVMVWRARLDGGCEYVNAQWRTFTGAGGPAPSHWADRVHPDDVQRCEALYHRHSEQRAPFEMEYRLRRADGAYCQVLARCVPYADAAGACAGFIASCVELHGPHVADASAGADEFFEMSIDNVCVAGLDGYFKRVNPSWTRTLGWTPEELLSRPSVEFVHPDDREATLAGRQRLRMGGLLGPLVNRYVCKDGTHRWFEWRSVAHVERGVVYAVARDVTEQKLAEAKLAEAKEEKEQLERRLVFADRMASVGTLAAGVAHEINNPLSYVTANTAMLMESLHGMGASVPPERLAELSEMAAFVQEGAERIRKIVGGLKTFSRAEEERRAVIDVRPLLELSINMVWNEIRHRARLVKDFSAIPLVEADEARLGQVFVNLLINAAQALPEGQTDRNEIRVVTSTDATENAVIEVRDTGRGIPAGLLDRVFDPFFTTKPVGNGTGLGLSICHNIVTALGGEIAVSSELGVGTTFRLVLPRASGGARNVSAAPSAPKQGMARAAVLVLDDEPAIGTVLRRVLGGHEVTTVTSAKEALALLAAGKHFDIIFSDLMMPEMSGMDFYAELLRAFPETAERVIFVSGGAFTAKAKAFLDRVPNRRIEKPFDPRNVRDLVQRAIG